MTKPINMAQMRNAGLIPLETKDENGSSTFESLDPEVKSAMDSFLRTVEEFKSSNDDRLKQIEEKMSADVITTEKVDRINKAIDDQQKAIDDMVAVISRKQVSNDEEGKEATEYKKALDTYIRKGEVGLSDVEMKTLSVGTDPDGGYTVNPTMAAAIERVVSEVSPMRRLASVMTIGSNSYVHLVNVGGSTSGWVGETGSRSETSTPTLKRHEIPVKEIYAEPHATQQLLDDSEVSIEAWLAGEVQIEFAEEEGNGYINGTGVADPRGILSYTTAAYSDGVEPTWGTLGHVVTGAATTIGTSADPFIDMVYSLKGAYLTDAAFLMNRFTMRDLRQLKDGNNQYLWQASVQAGQPSTLMGYRVETDEYMPNQGANALVAAFGSFRRGYQIVDRVGIRVLRDPFTSKPYVKFYTTKRTGGAVKNFEAFRLLKCST